GLAVDDVLGLQLRFTALRTGGVAHDDARRSQFMLRLLVRSENAADETVSLTATARFCAPPAELSQPLLLLRPHLSFDRRSGNVRFERDRMLNAGKVGPANLQELIAAADSQAAQAVDDGRDLVVANLSHRSVPFAFLEVLGPEANQRLEVRKEPFQKVLLILDGGDVALDEVVKQLGNLRWHLAERICGCDVELAECGLLGRPGRCLCPQFRLDRPAMLEEPPNLMRGKRRMRIGHVFGDGGQTIADNKVKPQVTGCIEVTAVAEDVRQGLFGGRWHGFIPPRPASAWRSARSGQSREDNEHRCVRSCRIARQVARPIAGLGYFAGNFGTRGRLVERWPKDRASGRGGLPPVPGGCGANLAPCPCSSPIRLAPAQFS